MAIDFSRFDLQLDAEYKNRNIAFVPFGKLAGTYRVTNISSDRVPGLLNRIGGELPGYRISLDTKAKVARVDDRLNLPEEKGRLAAIRDVSAKQETGRQHIGNYVERDDCTKPTPPEEVIDISMAPPEASYDHFATWLWHLRRLVDAKKLVVIKGSMPEMKEIKQMGIIYRGDLGGRRANDDGTQPNFIYPDDKKRPKQTASN